MRLCNQGDPNNDCYEVQNFCKIQGQTVKDFSEKELSHTLSSITTNETIFTKNIQNQIYNVLKNIYTYGNRGTRNPYIVNDNEGYTVVYNLSDYHTDNIVLDLGDGVYAFDVTGTYGHDVIQFTYADGEQATICTFGFGDGHYSYSSGTRKVVKIEVPRYHPQRYADPYISPQKGEVKCYYRGSYKISNVNTGDKILQDLYNQAINFVSTNKTISNQPIITKELMTKIQNAIDNYVINEDRCNTCNTACNGDCQAHWECGSCDGVYQGCSTESSGGGGSGGPCCLDYGEGCYKWPPL